MDYLDDDGYPTEEALAEIRSWPPSNWADLLSFVKALWKYPDYWTQDNNRHLISTCGWSGNEDLIMALEENYVFWGMCWESSRRGGHYAFKVPDIK